MVPMLILLYLGSYWLAALCVFVGFVGTREFYNGFRAMKIYPSDLIAFIALFALYIINGFWPNNYPLIMGWLVGSIIASSLYMFRTDKRTPLDAMATMIGIIYVIFFSFHVVLVCLLRQDPYKIQHFEFLIVSGRHGSPSTTQDI